MNDRLERLARGLLRPMNPYVSALLGLLTLFWGVFVLNPLFEVFPRSPIYQKALDFAPEWAWGVWATSLGICILTGLYFAHARFLAFSLGFVMWHWFTVAGFLWWGDWQNTAGLTYTFIAIYAMFAYLNIRVNYVKQGIKHI